MTEPYTAIPLSPLRRIIAARMGDAKRMIPHFRLTIDVETDALLSLRAELNATSDGRVSINDCLIKACALSLMKHPDINVTFEDNEIHHYRQADVSVVIAIDGGLSTPVVRGAERKSVHEIGAEIRDLSMRAATGKLRMQEIAGGSFSVSNLGTYGIDQFDAIINAPQGAILAVGSIKRRVIVSDDGESHIAQILRATLSADHRCIDGTAGAAFLSTLKHVIEQPKNLLKMSIG